MANKSTVALQVGGVDSITAASTAQATGTALTGSVNLVTTAAGETAVVLPAKYAAGMPLVVCNTTATAALLFPPVGGKINGGSANASLSVAQNKPAICFCDGTNWWVTIDTIA